jgi:hypothetical protein
MSGCQISERHCENCGSTDREDLTTGDQGYSACCNELIVDRSYCRDHHSDLDVDLDVLPEIVGGDEPMSIFCEDCGGHDSPTHDCSLVTR